HLDDQLAAVFALQQALEGADGVFQALHDILAVTYLAVLDPLTHVALEVFRPVEMVELDEAAHRQALDQYEAHELGQPVRSLGKRGVVVMRDAAADRNAGKIVKQRQYGLEDIAADILEIDVD